MLQNATPLRKSVPGPPNITALMNMSLVLRLPRKMHLCRSSSNVSRLLFFFGNATKPTRFAHFWQGAQSLAPATQNDIWTFRTWCVLYILTSKCASRHNGVHFFDRCFAHFDCVQFFITHLPSGLCTSGFSEPTFDPPASLHSVSRLSCLFAHLDLLSSETFSFFFPSLAWLFPSLLFICPYCRKFDFHSIIYAIASPLEFPLGNGGPGPRHFLEIWILWVSHLWPNAFFRIL